MCYRYLAKTRFFRSLGRGLSLAFCCSLSLSLTITGPFALSLARSLAHPPFPFLHPYVFLSLCVSFFRWRKRTTDKRRKSGRNFLIVLKRRLKSELQRRRRQRKRRKIRCVCVRKRERQREGVCACVCMCECIAQCNKP